MAKINFVKLWETSAGIRIDTQADYHRAAEAAWAAEKERFEGWFTEEMEKLTPADEQQEFAEFFGPDGMALAEDFPVIHRRSLFLTCWSQMESQLVDLCRHMARFKVAAISFDDFKNRKGQRDRGVQLSAAYVQEITSDALKAKAISALKAEAIWGGDVLPLNLLRNAFAHRDGQHDAAKDPALDRWIAKNPSLVRLNGTELELLDGFIEHMITIERAWLKVVGDKVATWAASAPDTPP